MKDTFRSNIRGLGMLILIASAIPWFILTVPLLPSIFRQIVLLITVISYPLLCFYNLLFGGAVILSLPCKKLFNRLIFIAWIVIYTLLCWGWANIIIVVMMSISGHV